MSTRFFKKFTLKKLYCENSPIIISGGAIQYDSFKNFSFALLKFKNVSDKCITGLTLNIDVSFTDDTSKNITYSYSALNAEPAAEFGQKDSIALPKENAKEFSVLGIEVTFSDGETWNSGDAKWRHLSQKSIAKILPEYFQQIAYAKKFGKHARYAIGNYEKFWLCTCSTPCHKNETICPKCNASREELKNLDTEELMQEGILLFANKKLESKRLSDLKKAKGALESAKKTSEVTALIKELDAKIAKIKAKRKKVATITTCTTVPTVVITAAVLLVIFLFIPMMHYNAGEDALAKGNFTEAYVEFKDAGDYENSRDMANSVISAAKTAADAYAATEDYFNAYKTLVNLVEKHNVNFGNDYYIYKGMATSNYILAVNYGATNLVIPEGVTKLPDRAFYNCEALESITLPSTLKEIGAEVFYECENLNYIVIPKSVQTIGKKAFYDCENLEIFCEATKAASGWNSKWVSECKPVTFGATEVTYSFNTAGGDTIAPVTSILPIELPVPVNSGYEFAGWYTSPDYSEDSLVTSTYRADRNITLYAKWSTNDGSSFDKARTIKDGDEISIYASTNKNYYLRFTPTSSGTYIFETDATSDTDAYIYNSNQSRIQSDTNYGDVRLSYYFTANETYYFAVKAYSSSCDCKVTLNSN